MKKYLFSQRHLELIRFLKSELPKRIWWNVFQYIFEYNDFYIDLKVESSQDLPESFDTDFRVMIPRIEKMIGKFKPSEISVKLSENEKILDIYLVRTLLYFHDYRKSKNPKSRKTGYFGDFIVHPDSLLDKEIDPKTTNLVDVGLLIVLKGKNIASFIFNNDEDFTLNEMTLYDNFDFNQTTLPYQFIKIE